MSMIGIIFILCLTFPNRLSAVFVRPNNRYRRVYKAALKTSPQKILSNKADVIGLLRREKLPASSPLSGVVTNNLVPPDGIRFALVSATGHI